MAPLLGPRHLSKLEQFASSNVLVAFDYDGTLAPIVTNPVRARMREKTRRLLAAVAHRYPCIVISGRSREDLAERLEDIPLWHLTGHHGLEPWEQTSAAEAQVHEWVRALRDRLAHVPGIVIEDKTYSAAIHYRLADDSRAALRAIHAALGRLGGFQMMGGALAINLVPLGAPNKGVALERARRLLACDNAIYVGDDDSDETAFAAGTPEDLFSIRIGPTRKTAARYRLKNQQQVDTLLKALVRFRSDPRDAGSRHDTSVDSFQSGLG